MSHTLCICVPDVAYLCYIPDYKGERVEVDVRACNPSSLQLLQAAGTAGGQGMLSANEMVQAASTAGGQGMLPANEMVQAASTAGGQGMLSANEMVQAGTSIMELVPASTCQFLFMARGLTKFQVAGCIPL